MSIACRNSLKLEEDKNQLSRGLDPWSNPTGTTSTLHYLLQEKERAAQAQEQLQIYHHHQQQQAAAGSFSSYLQHQQHRRHQQAAKGRSGDGSRSSGESTPVAADAQLLAATAFGSGRIVRSAAGRKDRHSKVCTARGLRDRRVRLAAHTAIRFYDVQDRLGYDRPSKAVDWLIRNAKAAIEELPDRPDQEGLPAPEQTSTEQQVTSTSSYGFGNNNNPGPGGMTSSFLHSLGGGAADQVSDNVKSLFPSSSAANEEYGRGSPPDLLSRTTSSQPSPQELCLTLQSNNQHNNIFSHDGHHGAVNNVISSAGGVPGWPDHVQRMPPWQHHAHASENNGAGEQGGRGDGGGYMSFGMPPRQGALDQSGQLFSSHGEPLQSSGAGWAASARAWLDPLAAIGHQPTALSGPHLGLSHLVAGGGGFMGFLAPAAQRLHLQGDEEQGSEVMPRD